VSSLAFLARRVSVSSDAKGYCLSESERESQSNSKNYPTPKSLSLSWIQKNRSRRRRRRALLFLPRVFPPRKEKRAYKTFLPSWSRFFVLEELFSRDKVTRPRKTMMMRSIGVFVLLLYREREKKKRGPPKKRKQKKRRWFKVL